MRERRIPRAAFLKQAAAAVAAPWIVPSWVCARAPNEQITMGCIGLGGMGTFDLRNFLTNDDVRVLAVCDVDADHRNAAKRLVDEHYANNACAAYSDFRELIDRADLDTVLIATPDHWHAILSIDAAKAGKDIYCEKPISLTVAEGRAVVETMRRYARVYQSGTQRRSIGCFRFAVDVARSGMLGRLHTIHTYLAPGVACGIEPPQPVPPGFDYEMWLGPAPYQPYTPRRCHGSFRWIFDYSGGQLTDIGAHFNDLAQWGHDSELSGPVEYEGRAEFPGEGLFDTPVRFEVTATYADGVRLIYHDTAPKAIRFEGADGWVSVDDDGNVAAQPRSILQTRRIIQQSYAYMQGHHRDFLDCVRSRSTPIAPPEVAQRSTTTCHIGNICLRLGRKLRWNPVAERFVDDPEADRMLARPHRAPWRV